MSHRAGNDGDLKGLLEESAARLAVHSPPSEWAISSPETPSTPLTKPSIDGRLRADEDDDEDAQRSHTRSRPPAVLGQHGKRGSSESRKDRRASLATPHNGLRHGRQEALQELRNDIDSLKISQKSSSLLGVSVRDLHAFSDEVVSPAGAQIDSQPLPSPPPSATNGSPVLTARDEDHGTLSESRKGLDVKKRNQTSGRAASSVLDYGTPLELRQLQESTVLKERTGSISRPLQSSRTQSTPTFRRKTSSSKTSGNGHAQVPTLKLSKELPPLKTDRAASKSGSYHDQQPPSPIPDIMPLPPFSLPSFLQLELSSSRPSPLYMYRPSTTSQTYEPTSAKAERLLNFLLLPPQLERVLWFGTIACVDAWLYNFTILPIRFCTAVAKLLRSMARNCWSEVKFLAEFVPTGLSRMWQRQIGNSQPPTPVPSSAGENDEWNGTSQRASSSQFPFPLSEGHSRIFQTTPRMSRPKLRKHRRTRSVASTLVSAEKADIVKGCLIICSTMILMHFDASMMYHSIRGQAAIKLYVIYNVLEVFDRLFSAIGQDILECLFSPESLSRHPNGRSKILRPLSLFPLALIYVLIHATALYYQVITLNVAVNSYSNALLTLLMSNQFVEIKSTVFKRIEKENLFQMTCADVVERFQLWLMLMIIASRNIIETSAASASSSTSSTPPSSSPTLLPFSFTMFPSLSFSQILNPFILVLGTETLVDWLKHAYITKFNNVKPNLYGRFLDTLTKDYYGHAFTDPNLMKRIGLPVIPLTCLAIRAAVQTYHMAREQLVPAPLSGSVSIESSGAEISPTTAAALRHIDSLFLRVVGQTGNASNSTAAMAAAEAAAASAGSTHSWLPSSVAAHFLPAWVPDVDALLAAATSLLLAAALFLVLLAAKLVLGMLLLGYARRRYAGMKARERDSAFQEGRRVGGWGTVEVDDDKRRWIYADDPDRLRKLRDRDRETREKEGLVTVAVAAAAAATAPQSGERDDRDVTGKESKEGGGGGGSGNNSRDTVVSTAPKKGQNYEAVERYKLGGSKRIW